MMFKRVAGGLASAALDWAIYTCGRVLSTRDVSGKGCKGSQVLMMVQTLRVEVMIIVMDTYVDIWVSRRHTHSRTEFMNEIENEM